MDYDDLNAYNGDAEHDMWVDFSYQENTNELHDLLFDYEGNDDCLDNLNEWD